MTIDSDVEMSDLPPVDQLKERGLEWDWKSVQNLAGLSQPADPGIYINVDDPDKFQKLAHHVDLGLIVVLRDSSQGNISSTFQGALRAVVSDSDYGMFTDAGKRADKYACGETFLPFKSTVTAAIRKKGIWQMHICTEKPNPLLDDISALWDSPCAQLSSVTAATNEFWTNVCVGLGGYCERPIPLVTAYRVVYGGQHIYYSDLSCTTREAYLLLCRCLCNYTYGNLPNWKHITLRPGDTLIVPPTICIGGLSQGIVAVCHSFITPRTLPALEVSFRVALDAWIDPLDVKSLLIQWIVSSSAADGSPVEAKQCLWRLLALQDAKDPDHFTDMNAPSDVDELWTPVAAEVQCPIYSVDQCKYVDAYEISTDLEPAVAEKLMALVPKAWRTSNFFGWREPYSQMKGHSKQAKRQGKGNPLYR